jgi:hypothetical protein
MNSTLFDVAADGTQKGWRLQDTNPYASDFLRNWTKDLQGFKWKTKFGGEDLDKLDKFATWTNKNILYSTLGANLKSMLTQVFGARNAIVSLGIKDLSKGLSLNMQKGWRNFAMKNSNVLQNRVFEHGFDKAGNVIGKAREEIGDKTLSGLKLLDMETARTAWLGAFNRAKTNKFAMKEAIDYADDIVTKTQGSASKIDRIPIARTPTGRMFSLFQTFGTYDYSFLKKDVLGIGTKMSSGQRTKTFLRYAMATELANIMAEEAMGIDSPFPNPYKVIKESAENGDSAGITVYKMLTDIAAVHPIMGSAKYGKNIGGAALNTIEDLISRMNKEKKIPWDIIGGAVGKLSGVPAMGWIPRAMRIKELGGSNWDALVGNYPKKKKGMGLGEL